ncbi:glucose-1-phosphate thymidylyltransferase [Marinitenerispora sediminis]|uniref:Glucose-1-phosphate thymidylyltransferase n=1 Tax=Marinitenerispora sediminis TaxID=1931232 RepID=A0A368SXS2_9ACTN|nr:glucose-1-phosphate thymidylyltransferase [Marinitenerispora sediminis]RCV47825.1 glucose-1-phosphate thymidylyltransferase [Marinitenerispora sediminis]
MKALVLSGGSGTRLRPFSHSMPKQLVPVANRPVLEHVLMSVRGLGVTEIGVVVGDWAPEIMRVIGDGSRFGARITYIRQDRPLGLAHCVALARPFLGDDDFVMYLGDNVLTDGVAGIAAEFRRHRPAAHVVVHKVSDPRQFGVAELDGDGAVLRVVEKPRRPRSDLALIGVYFFTAAVHAAVAAIRPSGRGELEITDAIQWLLSSGAAVAASEYGGYWKDTGRPEDLLDCNRRLLGELRPGVAGEVDAASRLVGRVVVERGARVVRSRVEGPAIVGAGTVIEDSDIGPYTAIGPGCTVRSARIADSIVLADARISGAPGLRGSLIGRSSVIGPAASGRSGHRIVVGDHAVLALGGPAGQESAAVPAAPEPG